MREDPSLATMGRIATRAGVSRQAVYLHFQSWAGLLLALVRWIDAEERIFETFEERNDPSDPWLTLENYITTWLDYLPKLHPVPGFLARARDDAARSAWDDRMLELERLYREPIRALRRQGALRGALTTKDAVALVRSIASVHAWEFLVHDRGWPQRKAVRTLCEAARGAIAGA